MGKLILNYCCNRGTCFSYLDLCIVALLNTLDIINSHLLSQFQWIPQISMSHPQLDAFLGAMLFKSKRLFTLSKPENKPAPE